MVFGGEACAVRGSKAALHAEVDVRNEVFDGTFALDNHAHRDRLHAAGAKATANLLPKYGRELKSHQAVEYAPGLLGVDQVHVDVARIVYGAKDGRFGNFMKDNALGLGNVKVQCLGEVPRNGFSLAVLIAREPHRVGALGQLAELSNHIFFVVADYILRSEAFGDVDSDSALGQIADVAKAGAHRECAAEVFFDGLRFGGRFDDD